MFNLLHLSDLHFGEDHHFHQHSKEKAFKKTVAEAIMEAIHQSELIAPGEAIDHLHLGGDFFSKNQGDDLLRAKNGIDSLLKIFALDVAKISLIPGNHDLTWNTDHFLSTDFYSNLCQQLGVNDITSKPSLIKIGETPSSKAIYLGLLNSCAVESKELAGIGMVGDRALGEIRNAFLSAEKDSVLLLALHHHVLPISPREAIPAPQNSHLSITLDAVAILNCAAEMEASLIMHGHQHRACLLSYRNELGPHNHQLHIAAAGSVGAKYGGPRQFFLHRIGDHKINIHLFQQSRHDENKFELVHNNISVPLPHIHRQVQTCAVCVNDAELRFLTRSEIHEPENLDDADWSNLYLVHLSVVYCPKAREIVRRCINSLVASGIKCRLEGMYDLLGKWDLLLRIRVGRRTDFDEDISNPIYQALVDARMMERPGEEGYFRFDPEGVLNVKRELPSVEQWRIDLRPHTKKREPGQKIKRRLLKNTEAYEKKRCQRAFLYHKLPDNTRKANDIIVGVANKLQEAIDNLKFGSDLIEAIYVADNAVVIECFMTCADSLSINVINRTIESVLARENLQKFTMTCYAYDEEECFWLTE